MMNPGGTEPLRSSPLRTRPVFPPPHAIATSTTRVGSHSVQVEVHEGAGELENSTNSQPDDRDTNDAESILYSANSSLSQQYSPIQGPSRQVQYAPSVREFVPADQHGDDILLKYSLPTKRLTYSFSKLHHPIPTISPMVLSRNLSYASLPQSNMITHDVSDGGLATSTQRLAINSGYHTQRTLSSLFGPGAEPVGLPRLDSFLAKLNRPSFSPWTDVLRTDEIAEYQRGNIRKFPLLHLIPKGLSFSDLKSNRLKREFIPGIENDCWRFVVDVAILTAGSPYGKYISVGLFQVYIQGMVVLFVRDNQSGIEQVVLAFTGGGSMALLVVFLIFLLLVYKCRQLLQKDQSNRKASAVSNFVRDSDK